MESHWRCGFGLDGCLEYTARVVVLFRVLPCEVEWNRFGSTTEIKAVHFNQKTSGEGKSGKEKSKKCYLETTHNDTRLPLWKLFSVYGNKHTHTQFYAKCTDRTRYIFWQTKTFEPYQSQSTHEHTPKVIWKRFFVFLKSQSTHWISKRARAHETPFYLAIFREREKKGL